jgi:hypothetical protein
VGREKEIETEKGREKEIYKGSYYEGKKRVTIWKEGAVDEEKGERRRKR